MSLLEMDDKMTKARLINLIRTERARFDEAIAEVGEGRMLEPGVGGEWTVKDVIAHIVWHEREMVGVLQKRALVGSDLWDLPTNQRNDIIYRENRDRPLSEVLAESRQVYGELMTLLEDLTDEDLREPARFAEMPAEWKPSDLIANNTYEHYPGHTASIRAWLDKQSS